MEAKIKRRRRAVLAALAGVAAGAFAFGVALGDGEPPAPSAASQLSAKQLAGQRLVVGYPGAAPPPAVRAMVREGRVAGVILFDENLPSRAAGRRAVARLQAIPRPAGLRDPLLVMIDQEGGLVKRIDGAPTASAEQIGARGAAFAAAQGARTAANLRDVGVNVDLAPVLDVARPGSDTEETERGFGSSAAAVSASAIPFADVPPGGWRRRHRQALPRPRQRPRSTRTSRSSGCGSRRRPCAPSTRPPTALSSRPAASW